MDRRNNYDLDDIYDNKNINTFLLDNMEKQDFKDIINKMEEIIDERRKVSSN